MVTRLGSVAGAVVGIWVLVRPIAAADGGVTAGGSCKPPQAWPLRRQRSARRAVGPGLSPQERVGFGHIARDAERDDWFGRSANRFRHFARHIRQVFGAGVGVGRQRSVAKDAGPERSDRLAPPSPFPGAEGESPTRSRFRYVPVKGHLSGRNSVPRGDDDTDLHDRSHRAKGKRPERLERDQGLRSLRASPHGFGQQKAGRSRRRRVAPAARQAVPEEPLRADLQKAIGRP